MLMVMAVGREGRTNHQKGMAASDAAARHSRKESESGTVEVAG